MTKREHIFTDSVFEAVKEGELTGAEWEVVIIGSKDAGDDIISVGQESFLRSQNNRLYSLDALEESVPLWEGIKVFDNHLTQAEFEEKQGMRSPAKEWLGTIVSPWWDKAKRQLKGIFKVVDPTLKEKLKAAWDHKVMFDVGLSIDTFPEWGKPVLVEGNRLPVITGFNQILSVDLVGKAAAGGGFSRILAADLSDERSLIMDDETKAEVKSIVTDALSGELSGLVQQAVEAALSNTAEQDETTVEGEEEEVEEEPTAESEEEEETEEEETTAESEEEEEEEETEQETVPDTSGQQALEAVQQLQAQLMLTEKLDASKLPKDFRRVVESVFPQGTAFSATKVDNMIKKVRGAYSSQDTTGQPNGNGTRVSVGLNGQDWAELEFTRLVMGNHAFRALEHNENEYVQDRVTEAYQSWVKGGRPRGTERRLSEWLYSLAGGNPISDDRAMEALVQSNLSSLVKNALNVMLAASYSKRDEWWRPIVREEEVDTIDQATLVRTYGIDTLDVVLEGAAYTEKTWEDDEETATFHKRGNIVSVTMESLLNDKLGQIRTIPDRLANSWYNTLSTLVANVFTVQSATGPDLSDTGALFNSTAATTGGGHANLLTTALGDTAYGAVELAMKAQTDQALGAGEKLLIKPRYVLTPTDLYQTALTVRNSQFVLGSNNNDINPYYQSFDVIEVPKFTDVTDWAAIADPAMFPTIWLIYLRGLRVPELFTADSDVAGSMFTNDTIRYKVRLMTWRFSDTFDCAPVSDFRGIHKSNVAG